MVRASSGADISPRSSTSLPTMTASITSGNLLASSIVVSICRRLSSGRLDSQRPCSTFMPWRLRDLRNLVEPVIDRIGADAIGQRLELRQVLVDLPGLDHACPGRAGSGRRGTAHRTRSRAARRGRRAPAAFRPRRRASSRRRRSPPQPARTKRPQCASWRIPAGRSRPGFAYRALRTVPSVPSVAAVRLDRRAAKLGPDRAIIRAAYWRLACRLL